MKHFNYHCHTTYSDGHNSLQEYVQQALKDGMHSLGFSDHAPVPMNCRWAMPSDQKPVYEQTIQQLKTTFQDQIELYCGLEIDYIPGKISPHDPIFQEMELDYTIGSVHFVDAFEGGAPWSVDSNEEVFKAGLKSIFHNDIRLALHRYYQLIREMVTKAPPTIVAHLDRIKKNNPGNKFFNEQESWYQSEVEKTLEVIAQRGLILEVNTKSLYRKLGTDPYPSKWIIAKAHEMNIPVHLASDAHYIQDISGGFEEAFQLLLECGYREVKLLINGKWQNVPFNKFGLIPNALKAISS